MFVNKIKQLINIKKIDLSNFDCEIKLEKSFRRSISLLIKNSSLIIKYPLYTHPSKINFILKKKEGWIKKKIEEQRERKRIQEFNLRNNIYLFKGKKKVLKIFDSNFKKILLNKKNIEVYYGPVSLFKAKLILINWYKERATEYFEKNVNLISKEIDVPFKKLTIKDYKSKWGVCLYSKKEISINWRLIMAPESVSRYVVVHELCHLIQPNHSKDFWKVVQNYIPNYKQSKSWLNNKGFLLYF